MGLIDKDLKNSYYKYVQECKGTGTQEKWYQRLQMEFLEMKNSKWKIYWMGVRAGRHCSTTGQ